MFKRDTSAYFLDLAITAAKKDASQEAKVALAFQIACEFIDYTFEKIGEDFTEKPKKS